jgi:hydroxymethylglutaryl-CoA reductase
MSTKKSSKSPRTKTSSRETAKMSRDSRVPGFYRMSIAERLNVAAKALNLNRDQLASALSDGGLIPEAADKLSENVLGVYALPFSLALNFKVNGIDYVVPMAVEEPSVVAAASNAAKMVRTGGGFHAEADPSIMIGQIHLHDVHDPDTAIAVILKRKKELISLGNAAVAELVAFGGGLRDLEVRELDDASLVVHLLVDCRDAMGANMVNTICEQLAPKIAELSRSEVVMRILSNLCDRRLVRVTCSIPPESLESTDYSGQEVRDGVVLASLIAERDPYRAATHNKGIMNGIDPAVLATGNDWRAVEAGAHAYAAIGHAYAPLCTWRVDEHGHLVGRLEMPLALGIVGGTARAHRGAQIALQMLGVSSAAELAMVVASTGMACNLAALRALVTEGIQRGHMRLHARSLMSIGVTAKKLSIPPTTKKGSRASVHRTSTRD